VVAEIVSATTSSEPPRKGKENEVNTVFETRFARIGEAGIHYRTERIRGSDDAKRFTLEALAPYFEDKSNQEEFLIVTLSTQNQPLRIVRITRGTLDASLVHPREVFCAAIADCANSILLVHNHPSGDPTPSPQDIVTTQRLVKCGELLGIRVIDHLIVGDTVVSLAESGDM